jgi:hypothetical protein
MLDTYRRLEANGVIGRMMKVDRAGKPIIDPSGEVPGNMIVRPFQEFPKVIRRFKTVVDEKTGKSTQRVIETIVESKNEELRLLAENPDTFDTPLSPLERERNDLAQENAQQTKTIASLQIQMEAMMKQMGELAQKIDKGNAEQVALGVGRAPVQRDGVLAPSGRGIEAIALGKK